LPDDEGERFDELERRAREALGLVPGVVRDAIWFYLRSEEMPWPGPLDGRPEVEEIYQDGLLKDGFNDEGVVPNSEFDEVRVALEAVQKLDAFLDDGSRSEAFTEWFRNEYKVPLNLRHKRVWQALF
jgi:hypothetical protein